MIELQELKLIPSEYLAAAAEGKVHGKSETAATSSIRAVVATMSEK